MEPQEWRETSLKGRMAESLVHDLLKEAGNKVYRIGYEAILPGLTEIEDSFHRNNDVGEKIRAIPDFFVIDSDKNPYLIEIKFRWDSKWHENDAVRIKRIEENWKEAIIILVGCLEKPYFRVHQPPFDGNGNSLAQFTQFKITQDSIDRFDLLVEKYLKPTLHNNN